MIDHQINSSNSEEIHGLEAPQMEWLYCWNQSYGIVLNTALIKPVIKIVKQLVMICVSNFFYI